MRLASRGRHSWLSRAATAAALAGAILLSSRPAPAEPVVAHYIAAELISEHESVRPAAPFTVGILLRPEAGWHLYWRNPGHTGLPTRIDWRLPRGFSAGPLQWPHPTRFGQVPSVTYGYEGDTLLLATIEPPAGLRDGQSIDLAAKASWLVCRADACVPGKADLSLRIGVDQAEPNPDSRWTALFAQTREQVPHSLPQWTSRVEAGREKVILSLQAPAAAQPSVKTVEVFPIDNDLVDPDVEPTVTRTASGFTIELARAQNDETPRATFDAVLVTREGWDAKASVRAIEVSAPVRDAAGAATAKPQAAPAPQPSAAAATPARPDAAIAPPVAAATPPPALPTSVAPQAGAANLTLLLALVFAFAGGLILNMMPCVFPVLSLKVMGFVHVAHNDNARIRRHGLAFAAGVLVSFWILAGLLLALRAGGEGLGWGFQLQQPLFVAALTLLLFVMSLNLLGVFEVGSSLTGAAGRFDSRSGYHGSFLSGVLATVLATPCSAPFMGAALGYALVQPPAASLLVFTFLGLGMAAPYLLLSFAPWLLRALPRPGAWMETLRQAMAFPLFATVIWLVWVFGQQVGNDAVLQLLAAVLLLGIGVWIGGHFAGARSPSGRLYVHCASAVCLIAGLAVAGLAANRPQATACESEQSADGVTWIPYEAERLAALRAEGRMVFLDVTAAWCLSCKVNERLALGTEAVRDKIRELGVVAMKGDWTNRDPAITEVLESFGRSGVPLYVLYPGGPDSAAVVLPPILSTEIVLEALDRAAGLNPPRNLS
ncbi:MAG: thioredoxin family protein [Deltaproteobacteria bacterium]|nr:thioredoxin family protein [Deltaproteobacteria bacterium]